MEAEVPVQPPSTAEQPSDDRHGKRQKEHKSHKEKKSHKERKEHKEHKSRRDKRHSSDGKHGKDRAKENGGPKKHDGLESGEIEDMAEGGPCVSSATKAHRFPLPTSAQGTAVSEPPAVAQAPPADQAKRPASPGSPQLTAPPPLPPPPPLPGPPPQAGGERTPLPGPPERPPQLSRGPTADTSTSPSGGSYDLAKLAAASDPAGQHDSKGDPEALTLVPVDRGTENGLHGSGRADDAIAGATLTQGARGDSVDAQRGERGGDDRRRDRDAAGASRRDGESRRRSASRDLERERERDRGRTGGGRNERDRGAPDRAADAARRPSGSTDRDRERERERDRDRHRDRDRALDRDRDRDRGRERDRGDRVGGRGGSDRRDGFLDRRREPADYDRGRDRRPDDRYARDSNHSGRSYDCDRQGSGRLDQDRQRRRDRDDRGDRRPDAERPREQQSSKRKREEADEADVMAEFEEMMTEEEREQQELEARRQRLAEINAKLERERQEKQASAQAPDGAAQAAADPPHPPIDNVMAAADAQSSPPAAVAPPVLHPSPSALPQHAAAGCIDVPVENGGRPVDDADAALRAWDARAEDDDGDENVDAAALFQQSAERDAPGAVGAGSGGSGGGGGGIDIFASDDDEEEAGAAQNVKGMGETIEDDDRATVKQAAGCKRTNTGLSDMYDDSQGYYNFRVGEIMDGRYEVIKASGKGVFSSVVKARDKLRQDASGANPEVAIKLIRANDVMYKAGKLEQQILDKLASSDPENRKHIIRLLRSFEYRNHLCLVFENMEMNLRELTRKVGVGRGIKIEAVGNFALQMLIALRHLRDNNVLHADIKPDNILINDRLNKIKLCDLGSAMFAGGNEPTPYLVSRFYRAPEVILGLPYDFPMDMWSIAAAIYELFTADILFKGRNNNEMLRLMMDLKGPFPKKMIRKGLFSSQHFADDPNMSFISTETDVVTKEPVKRLVANPEKKRTFLQLLTRAAAKEHKGQKIPKEEMRKVEMLADFLERCTALDPAARMTPSEAIQHRFIQAVIATATKNSKKAKGGK